MSQHSRMDSNAYQPNDEEQLLSVVFLAVNLPCVLITLCEMRSWGNAGRMVFLNNVTSNIVYFLIGSNLAITLATLTQYFEAAQSLGVYGIIHLMIYLLLYLTGKDTKRERFSRVFIFIVFIFAVVQCYMTFIHHLNFPTPDSLPYRLVFAFILVMTLVSGINIVCFLLMQPYVLQKWFCLPRRPNVIRILVTIAVMSVDTLSIVVRYFHQVTQSFSVRIMIAYVAIYSTTTGAGILKETETIFGRGDIIVLLSSAVFIIWPHPETVPLALKTSFHMTILGLALINIINILILLLKLPHPSRLATVNKRRVAMCSSAVPENTEGFLQKFGTRFKEKIDKIEFLQLPYSKLDEFPLADELEKKGTDILILCHSIDNRRLSLTDVTDALYNNFIPRASAIVGKEAFVVIAHDFKWSSDDDESRKAQEDTLKIKQPTTYKHAGNVFLSGFMKEAGKVGVCDRDWKKLEELLEKPLPKPDNSKKFNVFSVINVVIVVMLTLLAFMFLYYIYTAHRQRMHDTFETSEVDLDQEGDAPVSTQNGTLLEQNLTTSEMNDGSR